MAADLERAKRLYPSIDMDDRMWAAFFDTPAGEHAMGRIIGDIYDEILRQEERERGVRRIGRRPRPEPVPLAEVYARVFPPRFSNVPFGQALRDLLAQRKISQRAFAAKVPVNNGTLSRFINGVWTPDLAMMERIAAVAGVPPSSFPEYRAAYLTKVLGDFLAARPHVSTGLYRQLDDGVRAA